MSASKYKGKRLARERATEPRLNDQECAMDLATDVWAAGPVCALLVLFFMPLFPARSWSQSTSSTPTHRPSGTKPKPAVPDGPSLSETMNFIADKVAMWGTVTYTGETPVMRDVRGHSFKQITVWTHRVSAVHTDESRCIIDWNVAEDTVPTSTNGVKLFNQHIEYRNVLQLRAIDLNSIKTVDALTFATKAAMTSDMQVQGAGQVLTFDFTRDALDLNAMQPPPDNPDNFNLSYATQVFVDTQENSGRLEKAIRLAAKKCGAKESPF